MVGWEIIKEVFFSMNSRFFLFLFIAGVVFLSGCQTQAQDQALRTGNVANTGPLQGNNSPNPQNQLTVGNFTVKITPSGYEPAQLTIKKGSTVAWVNESSGPNWPATASHPTHTVYPGSDIQKCGTAEQPNIFDACKGLTDGESFSFTFNNAGEWAYHDHLTVSKFGKIIVKE